MVLGSATVVDEAGQVVEVFPSTTVVLGSVSSVVKVKTRSVVEVCSSTTGVVASVSAVGEVKIGSQVGIGR